MSRESDFVDSVLDEFGPVEPFAPCAYYDPSGDCIEFQLSNKPFCGKRLNRWITMYYSESTNDITGGLIKDVNKLMR